MPQSNDMSSDTVKLSVVVISETSIGEFEKMCFE
jgi:hypothetical protein